MKHALFLAVALAGSQLAQADVLNTPNFTITITSKCPEGEVTCNNVSYVGVSKKSGQNISLKGKTLHTKGPGGTPGRFLGYEFKNGAVRYLVTEEGDLIVSQGEKVLVKEAGKWE
jgi:hypothetical protein